MVFLRWLARLAKGLSNGNTHEGPLTSMIGCVLCCGSLPFVLIWCILLMVAGSLHSYIFFPDVYSRIIWVVMLVRLLSILCLLLLLGG